MAHVLWKPEDRPTNDFCVLTVRTLTNWEHNLVLDGNCKYVYVYNIAEAKYES